MEDRYYFRKNRITATILSVFAIVQLMLGIGLGYYWNGLQGLLSGIDDVQSYGVTGNVWGDILVYVFVFAPIVLLAFFSPSSDIRVNFRFVLIAPFLVYLISAIIEFKHILPLSEHFKSIYTALDNVIYIPFIICFLLLSVYYILVISVPKMLGTRAIGVLVMIVAITFYIIYGIYIVYLSVMNMLAGDFGTMQFIMRLICFALDAATFFLALSVLMTYCAMHRETLLDRKDALRKVETDSDDFLEALEITRNDSQVSYGTAKSEWNESPEEKPKSKKKE
ncbi:MAG: hypothetical protein LBN36_07965 [Clostridiales Family XIII bacterium]|jgi:hypothetical protein|nr:hypothetical protein [Clostridiales Family XIII bacterium]